AAFFGAKKILNGAKRRHRTDLAPTTSTLRPWTQPRTGPPLAPTMARPPWPEPPDAWRWARSVAITAPPLVATWANDTDGNVLVAVTPCRIEVRRADGRVVGATHWAPQGPPLVAIAPLG